MSDKLESLDTTPKRIRQGVTGTEKLYTVRPRNTPSILEEKTRGTAPSIRFILPGDLTDSDKVKWTDSVNTSNVRGNSIRKAFKKAIDDGDGYFNFILQNINYSIQEKSQIMHTFGGKEAVYFYGKAPIQVNLSGLLIDDLDNNQFAEFLQLYQQFLSGSRAAQDYCYVELSVNNATFTGSFTSIQLQQSSDRDTDVSFSASFLAKTFTVASTDPIFTSENSLTSPVVAVRGAYPTLTTRTQEEIRALNEAFRNNTLSYGDYTRSFGTLPTISKMLGFDASDIFALFSDLTDLLKNITAPVQDLINQVDGYVSEVISVIEAVEKGVDQVLNVVESAVKAVYGAIESIDNLITKVQNFPETMAGKFKRFTKGGALSPEIAGSESVSQLEAIAQMNRSIPEGSARGTPEGDAAVVAMSASDSASLALNRDTATDLQEAEYDASIYAISLGRTIGDIVAEEESEEAVSYTDENGALLISTDVNQSYASSLGITRIGD